MNLADATAFILGRPVGEKAWSSAAISVGAAESEATC